MDPVVFTYTSLEDWDLGFEFVDSAGDPVDMSGRSYRIKIYNPSTRAVVATLSTGDATLAVSGASNQIISGRLDNSTSGAFQTGLTYGADLTWFSGSEDHRIVPAVVRHVLPGTGLNGTYSGAVTVAIDPDTLNASAPVQMQTLLGRLQYKRVETFTASGTFTKQTGDVLYYVIAVGAGGGGGSGRKSAAGTAAGGGAGGNAGNVVEYWIPASTLSSTTSVTIGAGGAGASAAADDTNGASGSTGGTTVFGPFTARGGQAGGGGTNSAGGSVGSQPSANYSTQFIPSLGGSGSATSTGGAGTAASGPSGGGGGAGMTTGGTEANGGASADADNCRTSNDAQGQSGGTPGGTVNGTDGITPSTSRFGSGGAGGASKATGAAGNGGTGGAPGGGGGGGAGARNGTTGGAGGTGGRGQVTIYVYG